VLVGIFSRRIADHYAPSASVPIAVASPWQPTDLLTQITIDNMIATEMQSGVVPVTRDIALRVPGIKRAHGVHCTLFAQTTFRLTDPAGAPLPDQPKWLGNSKSGVSPYHRKFGVASDLFFNGWAALGFTEDKSDALHIPFGAWSVSRDGKTIDVDGSIVPAAYQAQIVVIPLGYGENGLLVDGIDTVREARLIEAAYMDRLENPVPLTILGIPKEVWESWSVAERKQYRDQYADGRKSANGSIATKVAEFPIDFPGEVPVDLYESGRNAVRLDIANHTGTPAGVIEGVRQGGSGGGTEMRYTGVANGAARNELWDFGKAKQMVLAFEARLSLDDVSPEGTAIRGDASSILDIPNPVSTSPSEA
jgi:hypothetical protein